MDAKEWERVQALFHEAAALPAEERAAWLAGACSGTAGLADRVLAMLDQDERDTILDRGLADLAGHVLAAHALPRDLRFGPYRITRFLGEGGMGVVYAAERADLGSTAAIKIMRDAGLSPSRRARFTAEQRMLAQLQHPNIARIYDADTLPDGTPWFVMEYVDGVPLDQHWKADSASVPERLRLFRSICEAVRHAHTHAIIHRDLKPSNILVTADGTVKLLDFGIARSLGDDVEPDDRTRTGLRLMTPAFAAPEQIRGGPVGTHTDVYALGVLLYLLLTDRLPFDDDVAADDPARFTHPVRPSVAVRESPRARSMSRAEWADLDVLCLTAMHADPERRYRTADALVRDIDSFQNGQPLDARPDSVSYRVGKFVRRNRAAVAAVAIAMVLGAALIAFYTVRLTESRDAAVAEARRAERIQQFMLSMFDGGDPDAGPADTLRVVSLLDRGIGEARALDLEPEIRAELLTTLGILEHKLGHLGRADSLIGDALQDREARLGPDDPGVARNLVALGLLRLDQADPEEAERLVRTGRARSMAALPADHPDVIAASIALGRVLEERGEWEEAIVALEDAVRVQPGTPPTPALASTLGALANVHFYAGNYPVSDSINRQVLAMHQEMYGERHPRVADDLINLGAIRFEQGLYAEAETFYRDAVGIFGEWYGMNDSRSASALTMLGRSLVYQQRPDEAADILNQSLAVQERVFGPVHPRVASALNDLGNVAIQRGQLDEAETNFVRMADTYRGIYGDQHYLVAVALSNQATVMMERADYARAETIYRDVVRRFGQAQGPEHSNTAIARIKLGRALLRQRRWEEAAGESLAGYDILSKQADAGISFLRAARRDLVVAYDSLGLRDPAERFRAELADSTR